jgi:murein tripeptide amidase MpaA
MIKISSDFDHGNIDCLDASDASDIRLKIKPDGRADFFQWFNFRVEGAAGAALTMRIANAGASTYVAGWRDYRAVASYDGEVWFRVDTAFDGQTLTIEHTPDTDAIQYAYFGAYPTTRYRDFVARVKQSPLADSKVLGETLDGQAIDYFRIGEGAYNLWVIARQHPGEDMGSWWMEGFLDRLTDENDETVKALRAAATLHVVPCMNLDGVRRGHLRTNAAGIDLNRAWQNTTMDKSPEVFLVREEMRKTGVDFFLDAHGDEAIPNNFLDSAIGIPSWDDRHRSIFERYSKLLLQASDDFQTKDGYPAPPPRGANLAIANNYVAEIWNCLTMTLEMPFKDANVNPDPVHGWSPQRCRNFAREHIDVMAQIVNTGQ